METIVENLNQSCEVLSQLLHLQHKSPTQDFEIIVDMGQKDDKNLRIGEFEVRLFILDIWEATPVKFHRHDT